MDFLIRFYKKIEIDTNGINDSFFIKKVNKNLQKVKCFEKVKKKCVKCKNQAKNNNLKKVYAELVDSVNLIINDLQF